MEYVSLYKLPGGILCNMYRGTSCNTHVVGHGGGGDATEVYPPVMKVCSIYKWHVFVVKGDHKIKISRTGMFFGISLKCGRRS